MSYHVDISQPSKDFFFFKGRILETAKHRILCAPQKDQLSGDHGTFYPDNFNMFTPSKQLIWSSFQIKHHCSSVSVVMVGGSGASATCPCFTNHQLAGIWQHVKSSQDSCFSTICWITTEITRLLGRLPDGKQVCLWVEDSYFLSMLSHAVGTEARKKAKEKENGGSKGCVRLQQMCWNMHFLVSILYNC